MGPQISYAHKHRTHFSKFGLAGFDAYGPEAENKMYTLESLMKMNGTHTTPFPYSLINVLWVFVGHTHIDILKVDVESWEFDTLKTLVSHYLAAGKPLPFGQLQLEIHIWNKSFKEFLEWWEILEEAGLRPFMTEPNMVYQNYNKNGTPDLAEVCSLCLFPSAHWSGILMHVLDSTHSSTSKATMSLSKTPHSDLSPPLYVLPNLSI